MNSQLNDIKERIQSLALKINVPERLLPQYEYSTIDSRPYVDIDRSGTWYWIVSERGQESERKTTNDENELLYFVFDFITFSMALKYELEVRNSKDDPRRIIFSKQNELLGVLDITWQERRQEEERGILAIAPFSEIDRLL